MSVGGNPLGRESSARFSAHADSSIYIYIYIYIQVTANGLPVGGPICSRLGTGPFLMDRFSAPIFYDFWNLFWSPMAPILKHFWALFGNFDFL